jgi:predicted esterase
MQKRKVMGFHIFCLLLLLIGLPLRSQPAENLKILQAEKKFTVDGDLEDWAGLAEFPVQLTPEGQVLPPSSDLTVTARFSFDAGHFYAAVLVLDDRIEFPGRGRLEGDGFYLTFVDPKAGDGGDRSLTFGFSRFENEPLAVVSRMEDETAPVVRDVLLKVKADEDKKEVTYELAIPWKYVPYFRPFFSPSWAVNLSYDDLDAGQKKVVQLVSDPNYEPENPLPKKALPCEFVVGPPGQLEFQSSLNANHFYPEDKRELKLAIHSPTSEQGWQVRMIATTSLGNFSSEKNFSFEEGMNIRSFPIELEKITTGVFDVSLGILDDQGRLRYTDDSRFFLLDRQQFEGYAAKLSELKAGELAGKDTVFRESLPTLEIRLQWIKEFMEKSPPFADLQRVQQWNQDITDLFRKLDEGKPALFPTGRIVRLGYRSEADGNLRSYSVLVPDWYNPETPLPLLVTLSGRGGGPRAGLFGLTSNYFGPRVRKKAGDFFILAPEVEDPSSWYIGGDGHRVLETIEHLKKIYSVDADNIILDGFAKGGYGALRLALQNPGVFKGVIVRSGQLIPPENSGAENINDMLDRAKGLNILFIHSEQDKDAPIDEIRDIVTRLQDLKANVRFVEVKGAGPRDFDKWSDVFNWLRDVLGDSVIELKPPKKGKDKDKEPDKKK